MLELPSSVAVSLLLLPVALALVSLHATATSPLLERATAGSDEDSAELLLRSVGGPKVSPLSLLFLMNISVLPLSPSRHTTYTSLPYAAISGSEELADVPVSLISGSKLSPPSMLLLKKISSFSIGGGSVQTTYT